MDPTKLRCSACFHTVTLGLHEDPPSECPHCGDTQGEWHTVETR